MSFPKVSLNVNLGYVPISPLNILKPLASFPTVILSQIFLIAAFCLLLAFLSILASSGEFFSSFFAFHLYSFSQVFIWASAWKPTWKTGQYLTGTDHKASQQTDSNNQKMTTVTTIAFFQSDCQLFPFFHKVFFFLAIGVIIVRLLLKIERVSRFVSKHGKPRKSNLHFDPSDLSNSNYYAGAEIDLKPVDLSNIYFDLLPDIDRPLYLENNYYHSPEYQSQNTRTFACSTASNAILGPVIPREIPEEAINKLKAKNKSHFKHRNSIIRSWGIK